MYFQRPGERIHQLFQTFEGTLSRSIYLYTNFHTPVKHSLYFILPSKLKSKTVPVLPSLDPSRIFHFRLLPSPVHLTGFFFCFFPGFLTIFVLLSLNNNITFFDKSTSTVWNTDIPRHNGEISAVMFVKYKRGPYLGYHDTRDVFFSM